MKFRIPNLLVRRCDKEVEIPAKEVKIPDKEVEIPVCEG